MTVRDATGDGRDGATTAPMSEERRAVARTSISGAALHLYYLFDVAYSIDLERARESLVTPAARMRPVVSRGASIDIPNLPLEVAMGAVSVALGPERRDASLFARVYDLGILAFRLALPLPEVTSWDGVTEALAGVQSYPAEIVRFFEGSRDMLARAIAPAIERPNAMVRTEDYTILAVESVEGDVPASRLARDPDVLRATLGEHKPLSEAAAQLAVPLSYYADDLIVLTWSAALVVEPDAAARDDATFLLEFANVQLLALRSYDAQVEADLERLAPQVLRLRRQSYTPFGFGRTGANLRDIYGLIADITESSARVENALKVTEDVYWNRVYTSALSVLRVGVWRQGINETLDVLRQTASLLHEEAEIARATFLEVLVIALIAVELIVALFSIGH